MMEKRHSCFCRKEEPLQGFGVAAEGLVAAALWWNSRGTARQEASSLLALSPCELLVEESNALPCSALNGSQWGAVSSCGSPAVGMARGASSAEVSCQLRFARWSQGLHSGPWWECKRHWAQTARGEVQAGQKERHVRGGKSQAMEQLPREGSCTLCPQRLSRPGHTKPTATWCHLALD